MRRSSILAVVLTLSVFAGLAHWASAGPAPPPPAKSLVGSWLFTVDTNIPGTNPIRALLTFDKDGTLTETNAAIHENSDPYDPICACNASDGHGIWRKIGPNEFEFEFRNLIYASDGTFAFDLDLTEPLLTSGQNIGFGISTNVVSFVDKDTLTGQATSAFVNLDGDQLNDDFPPLAGQTLTAQRMKFTP